MSAENGFHYGESLICAVIGLSRADAKLLRNERLVRGVDWEKKDREVALSRSGVKKLWRCVENAPHTLDLEACRVAARREKNGDTEPLALPEPVTFARPARVRVTRLHPNRELLQARDSDGNLRTVWVGRNDHFAPGMTLPAAPSPIRPGFYQLVGRLPRYRGRW